MTDRAEEIEQSKGYPAAKVFADIALGVGNPIEPLIAPWEASIASLAPKTKALYVPIVKKMALGFKTREGINRKAVRAWILEMQEELAGFTTLLENVGVPENVAADIVGHEKNTMTYGLYSGGAPWRSSGRLWRR